MASKTVNEDLMIVTQGSKHLCDTKAPTDACFLIDKKTVVPYRNYIETSACDDAQAAQKTLIRGYRIVHSQSKIGKDYGSTPSKDDNFQGFGGGVANGQVYYKHANDYPGSHSKNVKVEGKWIVRTNDTTQQNKRNTVGKFREGNGGITEDELEALLNKGCTVESVSAKCNHRDTPTDRIAVLEGDKVTVKMVHVNDAEVEPAARAKPQCQVPRRKAQGKLPASAKVHPYFRVTRSAYPKTVWREALPELTKEIAGLTIVLESEWLGKEKKEKAEDDDKKGLQVAKDPKDQPKTVKDSYDKLGKIEGPPPLEGARQLKELKEDDSHIPAQQARGQAEAHEQMNRDMQLRSMREQMANETKAKVKEIKDRDKEFAEGREHVQAVKKAYHSLTSWYDLKQVFYAKPIEVKVEAQACAGAKSVTIAAYPPGNYQVDLLEIKEFITVWKAVKDSIAKIKDFLKKIQGAGEQEEGAGADVSITAGRFKIAIWVLKDAEANLGVEWRELERDSAGKDEQPGRKKHEVFRAFTLDIKIERLIGLQFSYSIPVTYAVGALGAFAQKLLDKIGADLNVKFEIEFSFGVSGALEFDQYGKIIWLRKVDITPVAKFTISLNLTARSLAISIGATGELRPHFEIEPAKDQPMVVVRKRCPVDVGWFVKASWNIFGWTVDLQYSDKVAVGYLPEAKYALS